MNGKKEALIGKIILGAVSMACAGLAFCLKPKDEIIDVEAELIPSEETVTEEVTKE